MLTLPEPEPFQHRFPKADGLPMAGVIYDHPEHGAVVSLRTVADGDYWVVTFRPATKDEAATWESRLRQQLADAEAETERLRRRVAAAGCREVGHDWQFTGGMNAGCDAFGCTCSVPVHTCAKCSDCDYGVNDEAADIRARCHRDD